MADYQTSQTNAYLDQINRQRQTPYAAQNGMNTGGAAPSTQTTQQKALTGAIGGNATGTGSSAGSTPTASNATGTGAAAPQPTAQPQAPAASGASPVTGDGKINELNPPVPQVQPMSAPTGQDPFASIGGGVWTGSGWLPRNHPEAMPYLQAQQASAQAQMATQQATQPAAPNVGPYQMGTQGSLGQMAVSPMGPNGMPARTGATEWTPGTISQYGGGINAEVEAATQDALLKALAGGGGLPVELLKGSLRDDTLAMRDNELQAIQQSMAGSGRLGGGFSDTLQAQARENALNGLIGGYRDLNIQDALARNQFGLQAIGLGDQFLNSQQGRFQNDYKTQLAGQLAQEDLLERGAANSRSNYLADLQGWLGKYGADTSAGAQTTSARIGADADMYRARLGLLGDVLNIMENGRQADMGTAADWGRIQASILGGL